MVRRYERDNADGAGRAAQHGRAHRSVEGRTGSVAPGRTDNDQRSIIGDGEYCPRRRVLFDVQLECEARHLADLRLGDTGQPTRRVVAPLRVGLPLTIPRHRAQIGRLECMNQLEPPGVATGVLGRPAKGGAGPGRVIDSDNDDALIHAECCCPIHDTSIAPRRARATFTSSVVLAGATGGSAFASER